jgi:hypothetical protein
MSTLPSPPIGSRYEFKCAKCDETFDSVGDLAIHADHEDLVSYYQIFDDPAYEEIYGVIVNMKSGDHWKYLDDPDEAEWRSGPPPIRGFQVRFHPT